MSGGLGCRSHVGDSGEEDLGSGSELSPCGCAETNARHVDGGIDGGGGDGSELTGWGRVGVGDGKRRGVVAAKYDAEAEAEAKKGLEGHMAGVGGQRNRITCPNPIQYCSIGGRWQRLADFCCIVAEPSVLHQECGGAVYSSDSESGPLLERPDPCCAFQVSQPQ